MRGRITSLSPFHLQGVVWPRPGERFWERAPRQQAFPASLKDSGHVTVQRDGRALHVMHIAAELAPIGKVRVALQVHLNNFREQRMDTHRKPDVHVQVGGLGDVVAGLSKACIERGE